MAARWLHRCGPVLRGVRLRDQPVAGLAHPCIAGCHAARLLPTPRVAPVAGVAGDADGDLRAVGTVHPPRVAQ
uniref:Uncharacterized protein n=1 Tax=Panagrolaimus superbus TaxID=310955 RepID=A0A914Z5I4_9BILA